MQRDLTQGAQVKVQIVSEDPKSVRQTKKFKLDDWDLDTQIRLRVFLITDLLCITINDGPDRDFAVSLRLCELPLNFGNPFVYYIQINSKQIALKIDID